MSYIEFTTSEVFNFIPQQKPFRFVDEIISINKDKIVGAYTFKQDEFFYSGHFPGNPITPGVILLESMAQVGVVAFAIYLLSFEISKDEMLKFVGLFTDSQLENLKTVLPGMRVIITAEKIFWRRRKISSKVEMHDEQCNLVATSVVSGMGVLRI